MYGDPKEDNQLSHILRILEGVHALYYPPPPSSSTSSAANGGGDKKAIITNGGGNEATTATTATEEGDDDSDESHLDNLINGRPKNVAQCLATYRQQFLAGLTIVFSGVMPRTTDPRRSDLGYMAQALGAKLSETLTDETTHVVAENPNTEKVYHASRRKNVYVVTKMWLLMSFWHCERKNEGDFLLVKGLGKGEEEKGEDGAAMEMDDGEEGGGPSKKQKKGSNGVAAGGGGGDDKMEEQQGEEEEEDDEQERLANLLADDLG